MLCQFDPLATPSSSRAQFETTAGSGSRKGRQMAKLKQLTVSLENRPGALAQVARALADAKVNIVALLGSATGTQGSAQLVVDSTGKAKKVLDKAGVPYTEGTLERIELSNKPGALADAAEKLAKKGMNIDSAYATAASGTKKAVLLVSASQRSGE